MESIMTVVAGTLITIGTYLVLARSLLHVILGTVVFSHGVNLMLLTMAGLKQGAPPLLGGEVGAYTDPLPQALLLTAIVISFALTSYFLVLAYRTFTELGTDDLKQLRGSEDE